MAMAAVSLLLVVCAGPEGSVDGLVGPLDECLAEECGAPMSPVDPALLTTAFGDGGDASVLLHLGGGREAVALLAEGGEQARCEGLSGTGERVEDMEVVMGGAALSDGVVVACDGVEKSSELRRKGFDQQLGRFNDAWVGGECGGTFDAVDAGVDHFGVADAVVVEELPEGFVPCALCALEVWPLDEEVSEEQRISVLEPLQRLGIVALECGDDAIDGAGGVVHKHASGNDELLQRAHGAALRIERGESVSVTEQQVQSDLGIGRVVLGTAGRERLSVLGECCRVDGKDDEEVVLLKSGDDGPEGKFEANGNRLAVESQAQLCRPCVQLFRCVDEDLTFEPVLSGHFEAYVMLLVGPVEADEGGEGRLGNICAHEVSPEVE